MGFIAGFLLGMLFATIFFLCSGSDGGNSYQRYL